MSDELGQRVNRPPRSRVGRARKGFNCLVCRRKLISIPHRRRYCSQACRIAARRRGPIPCLVCGAPLMRNQTKACSSECRKARNKELRQAHN